MDEASEREAFEAWSKANGCGDDLRYKTSCDEYVNLMTHSAWQAWKGRAAVPVVQPQEPVAWMWTYIGVDPLNAHIKPCARSIHEMDPANPPYPDSWKALYPLYAAPLARQEPKPDAVYPVQPSSEAATARDAARYRWLTEDHADPATREKCRELLYRMPVMSYAAASHAIDIAMQGVAEE